MNVILWLARNVLPIIITNTSAKFVAWILGMSMGEVGRDFIHVHHISFISSMKGREHKVNPKTDLIPVCPNCHAILHRKINGKYLSPSELKNIINHR